MRSRITSRTITVCGWAASNLLFVAYHPALDGLKPEVLETLAVNLVLFVLPALGLSCRPSVGKLGTFAARSISISTLCLLVVLAAFAVTVRVVPSASLAWNAMWLLTNAVFVVGSASSLAPTAQRVQVTLHEAIITGVLFVGTYALYFIAATRVVPPLVDHDLEVQATGYSLIARFEPLLLTDRHTTWYFAHPPLLHFYVGASFLLHGSLPTLGSYEAASRRARNALEGRPITPVLGDTISPSSRRAPHVVTGYDRGQYILTPLTGGEPVQESVELVELARIYGTFDRTPRLLETRTPNIFLGASAVALLGLWAGRISRNKWVGALVATAYATSPEVLVRSSYGGYYAIGAFLSILLLLGSARFRSWPGWRRAILPASVGILAALSDHKLLLLPIAIVVSGLAERSHPSAPNRGLLFYAARAACQPVVLGFCAGLAAFWVYGLAIAPQAFMEDHVRSHLIDRLTHTNPLGYGGYATPVGLWVELLRHTGYLLLPVSLLLLVRDLLTVRGVERVDHSQRRLWLTWMLVTGVAFTLVDWRMTKHLMPLLIPLHLALVPARHAPRWRVIAPIVTMVLLLAWNAWSLRGIVADFASFQVTPAW